MGRLIMREGFGGSGVDTAIINAAAEVLTVDIEDLTNVVLWVTQVTDNGTVTLDLEISPDGTTWSALGSPIAESDLPAGAGTIQRSVSDSNGMPIAIKQARIRSSAYTGTGVYALKVSGFQRDGYR
jgi:hypothetical protein